VNPVLAVAVVQTAPTANPAENLEAISSLVRTAAADGARLVVLPEESMLLAEAVPTPLAELVDTAWPAFLETISDLSVELGVWIVAGGYEPSGSPRPYNTLVVVDDRGAVVETYRKLHLYDAFSYRESDYVTPGADVPPVVMIDGVAVGLVNCYDLRFPELARDLVDRGADVLSISAAWVAGPRKEDHWETLARARAIENTCWVVAAGSASTDCIGTSMVVDPLGVVRAALPPTGTGTTSAVVSLDRTAEIRNQLPSLANRRLSSVVTVSPLDDSLGELVARSEA
jgi:deaminated glutathione amidase